MAHLLVVALQPALRRNMAEEGGKAGNCVWNLDARSLRGHSTQVHDDDAPRRDRNRHVELRGGVRRRRRQDPYGNAPLAWQSIHLRSLQRPGATGLDAIVDGISVVEMDEKVTSVGYGGTPNEKGVVQLDACIMDGPHHEVGCVMALEGFVPAIPIARAVLDKSRHCIFAGEGGTGS